NSQFLIDLYASLDSANLKEKVFFSLSQRGDPGAIDWLIARARDSSEEVEVRKKALFWAVQGGADLTLLDGLYESLPDREMKEQVIFLYAQRDGSEAVGRLIEIARAEQDPELRKKAIFWLGQTGDERAAQFLLELLEEEPR
ncbi:MAG: HEAT repeat domain-containing protein, partial [Gemmatimonadota bacterium]